MNRLHLETSPYLLQHAENPVDWFPWGDEAFSVARSRDLPILLSIGYSACHWCHVMERESFADERTAALMNRSFVSVKVDREERPDVDKLYQGVIQLTGRGGGWPLTVCVLPNGRPFFVGTYYPADERPDIPSFPQVLESLAEAWRERRGEVESAAASVMEGLHDSMRVDLMGRPNTWEPIELMSLGNQLAHAIDPVRGGFGGAPKFPNPLILLALLEASRHGGPIAVPKGVRLTLDQMASGGIYDQLGGGFHRYAVDAEWRVPHFEKMLCDNALLIRLYTEAWERERAPRDAEVVEETIAWMARELRSPEGDFYASQDADTEGEEGRFFIFSQREILDALGPERGAQACRLFGVGPRGNVDADRSVLSLQAAAATPDERRALRAALFDVRASRTAPAVDRKILSGWNGLALGAIARAARAFDRADWRDLATRAADALLARRFDGTRLMRTATIPGMLEDYGDLAQGLVELYLTTRNKLYLTHAQNLVKRAIRESWDTEQRAFRMALENDPKLPTTVYTTTDDAWPSGASTLTAAMIQLSRLLPEPQWNATAYAYLIRMKEPICEQPFAYGQLLCALSDFLIEAWKESA